MNHASQDMESASSQKEIAVESKALHTETTTAYEAHHKGKKEKRLVLKQDLSIVLLLSGCYWFAYLVCYVGKTSFVGG